MADVFLPAVNPVNVSQVINGHQPLGGIIGSGDLTNNDGDTSGWEAYDVNTAGDDAGLDEFRYAIDASALPAGATITQYRFEMTVRLRSDTQPQSYPGATVSPSWTNSGGNYFTFTAWGSVADLYSYTTVTGGGPSGVLPPPPDMLTQLADGSARLVYGSEPRSLTAAPAPCPVRCTMGGIRVWYTLPTDPPPGVTIYGIPPLRQVQRGDGLGFSSAPRALQNNSVQGSLRNFGFN